jgi:hypothetical protein
MQPKFLLKLLSLIFVLLIGCAKIEVNGDDKEAEREKEYEVPPFVEVEVDN